MTLFGVAVPAASWVDVPFNAGDFTASASMTWTVAEGDVDQFAYSIDGKMVTIAINIVTSTVGGTPSNNLIVALPIAWSFAAGTGTFNYAFIDDNGAESAGRATIGGSGIRFWNVPDANFAASTDLTSVSTVITARIE